MSFERPIFESKHIEIDRSDRVRAIDGSIDGTDCSRIQTIGRDCKVVSLPGCVNEFTRQIVVGAHHGCRSVARFFG